MKKTHSVISFLFALFTLSLTLKAQTLKNLEANNGFKNYKLGSKYTPVNGIKGKEEDGSEKVVINSTNAKIGDIPVNTIELYYLKDTLAKILVLVSPEHHARLIEACKNSFGTPSLDRCDNESTRKAKNQNLSSGKYYTDQYVWRGKKINMEYLYQYPIVENNAYIQKDLHLNYSLNDYATRLVRAKKGNYSPKDF